MIPTKSAKTQKLNEAELSPLDVYFAGATFKDVKTQHLAAYRDRRKTKKRLRADGSVRDPGGQPAPLAANREWTSSRTYGTSHASGA